MTREQLLERHTVLIRQWARTIGDMADHVPAGLLESLGILADEYAADENRSRRTRKSTPEKAE